jgi:hypothetical protein
LLQHFQWNAEGSVGFLVAGCRHQLLADVWQLGSVNLPLAEVAGQVFLVTLFIPGLCLYSHYMCGSQGLRNHVHPTISPLITVHEGNNKKQKKA